MSTMANWSQMPTEIRIMILRYFSESIESEYDEYDPKAEPRHQRFERYHQYGPTPIKSFHSALLTCREFFDILTNHVKLDDEVSALVALQCLQHDKIMDLRWKSWDELDIFKVHYKLGRFCCNPWIDDFEIFESILGRTVGLNSIDEHILACRLEPVVEQLKTRSEVTETINVGMSGSNGHGIILRFTGGLYEMCGERFSFYNVSDVEIVESKDGKPTALDRKVLPDLRHAAPDAWWLAVNNDWKITPIYVWRLINYKEKRLCLPSCGETEWPHHLDHEDAGLWDDYQLRYNRYKGVHYKEWWWKERQREYEEDLYDSDDEIFY